MTTSTDTPRIRMASALTTDAGVQLKLSTIEGVEVEFLLDDLAAGLLGMTLRGVLDARKAQIDAGGDSAVRIFTKENDSE